MAERKFNAKRPKTVAVRVKTRRETRGVDPEVAGSVAPTGWVRREPKVSSKR